MTDLTLEELAEQSMALPDGKTCADCAHIKRCTSFGFTDSPTNTYCDFAPSRFRDPFPPPPAMEKP